MTPHRPCLLLSLGLGMLLGCQPEIGDECRLSADCGSATTDRVCDVTQPGGYCTIFNCEPATCPEEAICVAFRVSLSAAAGCEDPQGGARLARSFCMRRCESNRDCRSPYSCIDVSEPHNPWGAEVLERAGTDGRICLLPYLGPPLSDQASTDVCSGSAQVVEGSGSEPEPWAVTGDDSASAAP